MAQSLIGLFIFIFLFTITNAQSRNCSSKPIHLPVRDVTLSNKAAIRGVAMSVGSPPQALSFFPNNNLQNTWVYDKTGQCGSGTSDTACTTKRGGKFIPDDSKSYVVVLDEDAETIGADPADNTTFRESDRGRESLIFSDDQALPEFILGTSTEDVSSITTNAIGLGRNSTILSALKKAKMIGSRTWSFWYGLAGAEKGAQMDGSLILGGYDEAKIKGTKNHTGTITDPGKCPSGLSVTITDLDLNLKFPNGSSPNLLDINLGSGILTACLCPECPVMMSIALDPYFARFEEWTQTKGTDRSGGINFFTMMYDAGSVYQGDLIVGLDSGLKITVPNSQLVMPDMTINNRTGAVDYNPEISDVMLYSLQDVNRNDVPRLGRYFFTSAMLMVNNEAGTFTLWEANPTTDTNIVSITDKDAREECDVATSTIGSLETSTVIPSPPATADQAIDGAFEQKAKPTMMTGLITGVAVGGVALLGVVAAAVFCLLRRSMRNRLAGELPSEPLEPPPPRYEYKPRWDPGVLEMSGDHAREVYSGRLPPTELSGTQNWNPRHGHGQYVYELGSSTPR